MYIHGGGWLKSAYSWRIEWIDEECISMENRVDGMDEECIPMEDHMDRLTKTVEGWLKSQCISMEDHLDRWSKTVDVDG